MNTQRLNLFFPFSINLSLPERRVFFLIFWGGLLFLSFLLVFYLFQIVKLTEANYFIKAYNQKIEILAKRNSLLENRYNQLVRLDELEKKIKNLNLVEISEVKYLSLPTGQLAQEKGRK